MEEDEFEVEELFEEGPKDLEELDLLSQFKKKEAVKEEDRIEEISGDPWVALYEHLMRALMRLREGKTSYQLRAEENEREKARLGKDKFGFQAHIRKYSSAFGIYPRVKEAFETNVSYVKELQEKVSGLFSRAVENDSFHLDVLNGSAQEIEAALKALELVRTEYAMIMDGKKNLEVLK
jgi:hypothetical protein